MAQRSDTHRATKAQIKRIVEAYKLIYAEEYRLMLDILRMRRALVSDQKYAQVDKTDLRGLYEISETLQAQLVHNLNMSDLTWLKTRQGGQWFARTFSEFALPR